MVTKGGGKMFNFSDLVALAKQGYTPADIKQLIELSRTAEKEDSKASEGDTITENNANIETPSDTVAAPEEVKEEPDQEDSKIVDYKKKVEELEKKIADLQKANTEKNIADTDEKSDLDVFTEAMKSFM